MAHPRVVVAYVHNKTLLSPLLPGQPTCNKLADAVEAEIYIEIPLLLMYVQQWLQVIYT